MHGGGGRMAFRGGPGYFPRVEYGGPHADHCGQHHCYMPMGGIAAALEGLGGGYVGQERYNPYPGYHAPPTPYGYGPQQQPADSGPSWLQQIESWFAKMFQEGEQGVQQAINTIETTKIGPPAATPDVPETKDNVPLTISS